jgi:hypothetical protein
MERGLGSFSTVDMCGQGWELHNGDPWLQRPKRGCGPLVAGEARMTSREEEPLSSSSSSTHPLVGGSGSVKLVEQEMRSPKGVAGSSQSLEWNLRILRASPGSALLSYQ